MLLDRGLLAREGDVYRPTGPIEALDVPETLHALVAARLDGLDPEERRLLQDASVLGKSFTQAGLAALSGLDEAELEPLLDLARPQGGALGSRPTPARRSAGSTASSRTCSSASPTRRWRRPSARRAISAAAALSRAGVRAERAGDRRGDRRHYLDAYRAAPDADDAAEIEARAQEMLTRAGERAASLAANEEAQHYFERAAELDRRAAAEAALRERAGATAWVGRVDERRSTSSARSSSTRGRG